MKSEEFIHYRKELGLTQNQLAQLLMVSVKAIRSYEQGWRTIPSNIERQLLLLFSTSHPAKQGNRLCWTVKKCPTERRDQCPAWKLKAGHLCWFINGTICEGVVQSTWEKKLTICKQCEIFEFAGN
ncbi:MAG: transcriptional regulator [Desulfobacca sp.]|nr:transcriptional regulator [Desulfobacca sp.]